MPKAGAPWRVIYILGPEHYQKLFTSKLLFCHLLHTQEMSKNLNCSHQVRYYTIIFTIPMKSAHMTPQLHYTYTWIIDKLTNEKTGIFCDSPAESWQTLMVVLFRLSYLHSHRGQNSCSWPRIKSATFGNTMLSQSLEKKRVVIDLEKWKLKHLLL